MILTSQEIENIKVNLYKEGFLEVNFIPIAQPNFLFRLFYKKYLRNQFHANMHYLNNIKSKFNLHTLYPYKKKAKTLMVCLFPYKHKQTEYYLRKSPYKIARYAWGHDYHVQLKEKLKKALSQYNNVRYIVDSTPLPERYYARKAGLGFIGKNAMLIHPKYGSYFFLSFALLPYKYSHKTLNMVDGAVNRDTSPYKHLFNKGNTIKKRYNPPKYDIHTFCKDCNLCIKSCPTNALLGDGLLDANKCISYATIESKKEIPDLNRGKWIFGCDICQMVCPYNKHSATTSDDFLIPLEATKKVASGNVANLSLNNNSPLKRAGLKKIKENIKILQT